MEFSFGTFFFSRPKVEYQERRKARRIMAQPNKQSDNRDNVENSDGKHPSLETISNDRMFVERFSFLFNNEVFSDIILRVGNERYYAHKFMLITCSEVFEVMLGEERWRESSQPEITLTEELECVDVFSNFLEYIYTGSVDVTTDNVLPILLLADKYSIPTLRQSCVDYMVRHIVESPDTNRTLSWYQYSKMTGNSFLSNKCLQFILSNFDIILKTPDWGELSMIEIVEFLSSSDIVVDSEAELWPPLERWLMAENNRGNLERNLQDIIPLLRFTMMSPKNLLQIERSPLYTDHPGMFVEKLHAAYRHHSLLLDEVELNAGGEQFRNYISPAYGVCYDLSLLNYLEASKINSKINKTISIPIQFVAQNKHQKPKKVTFQVSFWPKGYFTTFTLYGNHIGRQSENTKLSVSRVSPLDNISAIEATITLIIYGVKNGVRYVAFTYTKSHSFSAENVVLCEENVISLSDLLAEKSPYLVNGNFDSKLFIKVQNIVPAEVVKE